MANLPKRKAVLLLVIKMMLQLQNVFSRQSLNLFFTTWLFSVGHSFRWSVFGWFSSECGGWPQGSEKPPNNALQPMQNLMVRTGLCGRLPAFVVAIVTPG